jgi:FAD synthase
MILTPDKTPRMLITTEQKTEILQQMGLDILLIICWAIIAAEKMNRKYRQVI